MSTSVPTRDAVAERVAAGKRLIYAQTHPYGAPKVMIRGGATKVPEVKQALKDAGFVWDGQSHGWKGYMYDEELEKVLDRARDMGASVEPYSD